MKQYTLPSGKASIDYHVSGGFSYEVTTPAKAKDRNDALSEALVELCSMQERITTLQMALSDRTAYINKLAEDVDKDKQEAETTAVEQLIKDLCAEYEEEPRYTYTGSDIKRHLRIQGREAVKKIKARQL